MTDNWKGNIGLDDIACSIFGDDFFKIADTQHSSSNVSGALDEKLLKISEVPKLEFIQFF